MASDSNGSGSPRARRGSFTSSTFNNIFGRSNSTAGPNGAGTSPFPNPITTASAQDQRRRMSLSTVGLSGTSPIQSSYVMGPNRRTSTSTTGSDSMLDENAIDDDDSPSRGSPTTPFSARRMSFGAQALRNARAASMNGSATGTSPSTYYVTSSLPRGVPSRGGGRSRGDSTSTSSPPPQATPVPSSSMTQASMKPRTRTASDLSFTRSGEGLNWSEQFRSRAESAVSGTQRPSVASIASAGGPNANGGIANKPMHERAKSVSEMAGPPNTVPGTNTPPLRKKPDAFGERMLKGDFYMD